MTSQTRRRLASGGDVSDDSALESDVSSLAGSEDGRSPSRWCAGARRVVTRPGRTGSRATSSARCAPKRDRMLLREWLQTQADRRSVPGMHWYNGERTMIRLPWKHGSRSGWTIDDCELYRAWAQYTGKCSNKVDEPKRWKANFRCALNSLPDVREMKSLGQTRGKDPFKVYELLDVDTPRKGNAKRRRRPRRDWSEHSDVDSVMVAELPPSCSSRLPTYVEQETAAAASAGPGDDDDEQLALQLLDETFVVDRTSTEPLQPMEEVLLSITPLQPVTAVSSCCRPNQPTTCTDISHNIIPTFVTEMGESLMDEIDEAEMLSAVESLESDQWSSTSSSPVSSDYYTEPAVSPILDDTFIQADSLHCIPSWRMTAVDYISSSNDADYTDLVTLTNHQPCE